MFLHVLHAIHICIFSHLAQDSPTAADQLAQRSSEFQKGLNRLQKRAADGQWPRVLSELQSLVDGHSYEDYVFQKRTEILEFMQRAAFWSGTPEPEIDTLISGDVRRFSRKNNQIVIVYTQKNLDDFIKAQIGVDTIYVHPMAFDGPYSVEVHGESFPQPYISRKSRISPFMKCPVVFAGYRAGQGYAVLYGHNAVQSYNGDRYIIYNSLLHFDNGDMQVLDKQVKPPAKTGDSFRLKMNVSASQVTGSFKGKRIVQAVNKKGFHGGFAFANLPLDQDLKITIRGRAHPSWIQDLQDVAVQAEMRKFEKSYRPEEYLPDWLVDQGSGVELIDVLKLLKNRPQLPDPIHASEQDLLDKFFTDLDDHAFEDAENRLSKVRKQSDLRTFVVPYLRACLMQVQGRHSEAASLFHEVRTLQPGFSLATEKQAHSIAALRGSQAAVSYLHDCLRKHGKDSFLIQQLVILHLQSGQFDHAKTLLETHIDIRNPDPLLHFWNQTLTKATHGPNWGTTFEQLSKHFEVRTPINQSVCNRAAKILEEALRGYSRYLHRVEIPKGKRFRVFIFGGFDSYERYVHEAFLSNAHQSAGMYSPLLKQLLIWNVPDPIEFRQTIRHEGFHQYFDSLCADPPIWLNEGLAVYYETAEMRSGSWKEGQVQPSHLHRTLGIRKKLPSLQKFVQLDSTGFYGSRSAAHYSYAWCLVYFLRHGGEEGKPLPQFQALLGALIAGDSREQALEQAFASTNWADLQSEFWAFLESLE